MSTPWPRSVLPKDRDPLVWNPMLDGIATLYRERKPGEHLEGLAVVVTEGERRSVLLLGKGGEVRRLMLVEVRGGENVTELECELGRGEEAAC